MDALEKWKRLTNPTCADDYGLSVTLDELKQTEEGRKILNELINDWSLPIEAPL